MCPIKLDKSKLVKSLGAHYKLVPYLEKAIAQGDFAWEFAYKPKETDTAWHPSSDCTPPVSQLLKKARGEESKTISGSLRKTFACGHAWHAYVQEHLKRMEFAADDAIERLGTFKWDAHGHSTDTTFPYHWSKGYADVAPVTIPRHGEFALDIKTMNSRDFARKDLPEWAAGKYEAQVNVYMDYFDLDRAIILCVQKDSPHDFKEFLFERNSHLVDTIYRRWKFVSHCLNEDITELPDDRDVTLPLKGPVIQ